MISSVIISHRVVQGFPHKTDRVHSGDVLLNIQNAIVWFLR